MEKAKVFALSYFSIIGVIKKNEQNEINANKAEIKPTTALL